MNKNESKYFNTALKMDNALLELIESKDFMNISVKEICNKAGVNRSTFYLHYETTIDLLEEVIEKLNKDFFAYVTKYNSENENIKDNDIYLISPYYLRPYLSFIKDNRKVYKVYINNKKTFRHDDSYNKLFTGVINPLMDKLNVEESKRQYINLFFIDGINAIVNQWLLNDCKDDIEFIIEIIMECCKRD